MFEFIVLFLSILIDNFD